MATFFLQVSIMVVSVLFACGPLEAYGSNLVETANIQQDISESKQSLDEDNPDKLSVQTHLQQFIAFHYQHGRLNDVTRYLPFSPTYSIRAPPHLSLK